MLILHFNALESHIYLKTVKTSNLHVLINKLWIQSYLKITWGVFIERIEDEFALCTMKNRRVSILKLSISSNFLIHSENFSGFIIRGCVLSDFGNKSIQVGEWGASIFVLFTSIRISVLAKFAIFQNLGTCSHLFKFIHYFFSIFFSSGITLFFRGMSFYVIDLVALNHASFFSPHPSQ